jgi:hypothetical protein
MTTAPKATTESAKSLQRELSKVARGLERARVRRRALQKQLAAVDDEIRGLSRTLRQLTEAAVAPELGGDGAAAYYCGACKDEHTVAADRLLYEDHQRHATADRLAAGR